MNAYTLVAKTDDDKRKWMSAIEEALHNVYPTPRYSHDVSMCTFDEPTICQFCSKLLKGLFYQVGSIPQKTKADVSFYCPLLTSACHPV